MYKILIPQDIHPKAKDFLLQKGYEIQVGPGFDEETLLKEIPSADALIARTALYSENVIKAGTKLKIIARHGVGVDNLPLEQAKKQNLWVTIAKGANVTSVAEHTITLILAAANLLPTFHDEIRKGNFAIRNKVHGTEISGKKLGLIGIGAIGSKVAEIAVKGFGMKILAFDICKPSIVPDFVEWKNTLEDVYKEADIITLHVPLTPETNNLINKNSIKLMKDGVIIVNCARGGIVNEHDLAEALKNGKVKSAGLDVFSKEPPETDNPLLNLENIVLTPHNAALTDEAAEAMAMSCAVAVDDVFNGRTPKFPIVQPN
ncbi:hydroxyacid dehydrogenase [Treponema sp. OMZ 840]|uniref:hydroxyacid dehydrogenase n=1 Tax=Treponema sp. OMZ 840 TaxID=244313 RepID=UPI003D904ECF